MDIELLSNISLACFVMVKNHMKLVEKSGFTDIPIPPHITVFQLRGDQESVGFERPQVIADPPFEFSHPNFCGAIPPADWANLIEFKMSSIDTNPYVGCVVWGSFKDPDDIVIIIKNKDQPPITLRSHRSFKDEPSPVRLEEIDPECALGFALQELQSLDVSIAH